MRNLLFLSYSPEFEPGKILRTVIEAIHAEYAFALNIIEIVFYGGHPALAFTCPACRAIMHRSAQKREFCK